jgi:hypothetical protein
MTTTPTDIVAGALRLISSVTPGEAIDGGEAANALIVLNQMYASWSGEGLMIPFRTIEVFPLVVGQQSYTMGTGANFNTARPDYITNAWVTDTVSLIDFGMDIIDKNLYEAIPLKSIQGIPKWLYYDTQYPSGVVYIFYTSALSTYNLNIESKKPIAQFSTLTSSMILPGEYYKASKLLLAYELAPEYGYPIERGSQLDEDIKEAKKLIKRKNTKRVAATFDAGLRSRPVGNIKSGWPGS